MVPVDYIFKRFPRMIRDLAKDTGKELDFKMIGGDIEIDRSLLDDIGDALMHILRNAVDHGLESPGDRKIAGKSAKASLQLSATTEQSSVVIIVEDDGRGMDADKIKKKAIKNGLITEEDALINSTNASDLRLMLKGFGSGARSIDHFEVIREQERPPVVGSDPGGTSKGPKVSKGYDF